MCLNGFIYTTVSCRCVIVLQTVSWTKLSTTKWRTSDWWKTFESVVLALHIDANTSFSSTGFIDVKLSKYLCTTAVTNDVMFIMLMSLGTWHLSSTVFCKFCVCSCTLSFLTFCFPPVFCLELLISFVPGLKYNFQVGGTVQLSGPRARSWAPIHFLSPCFNSGLSNYQW